MSSAIEDAINVADKSKLAAAADDKLILTLLADQLKQLCTQVTANGDREKENETRNDARHAEMEDIVNTLRERIEVTQRRSKQNEIDNDARHEEMEEIIGETQRQLKKDGIENAEFREAMNENKFENDQQLTELRIGLENRKDDSNEARKDLTMLVLDTSMSVNDRVEKIIQSAAKDKTENDQTRKLVSAQSMLIAELHKPDIVNVTISLDKTSASKLDSKLVLGVCAAGTVAAIAGLAYLAYVMSRPRRTKEKEENESK
jgi:hypothetical protein